MGSIYPAASVLLIHAEEVLLVRRADRLKFFGGFWAFAGGKVMPADKAVPTSPPTSDAGALVAAVRELFEETGILLARLPDAAFPADQQFNEARRELIENRLSFGDFLARENLTISCADLVPLGEITTPEFAAVRFTTSFFLAQCPQNQTVTIWPGELTDSRWGAPDKFLEDWRCGELLLSPPTTATLRAIHQSPLREAPESRRELFAKLAGGAPHRIEFAPGVRMIPLRAKVLPPATHTSAFLVGAEHRYLIDPGCDEPDEQARLFSILDEYGPAPLTGILLTHHHPDHVGAAMACAERYHVPILAHPATAKLLEGKVQVDLHLEEGSTIDLGEWPNGAGDWRLDTLFTPGHAPGHVVFVDSFFRYLFAGDMISTETSVLVAPPHGDLTAYIASLKRLAALPIRLLLPAHGTPSANSTAMFELALAHRYDREKQLLEYLAPGTLSAAATVDELAPLLYRGLPAASMKYARLQIEAGLEKLRREGRVNQKDGKWELMES